MAASIAGVFWRAVRLIRECRGRCLREARGYVTIAVASSATRPYAPSAANKKNLVFWPPVRVQLLFGLLVNGTVLKRPHVAF